MNYVEIVNLIFTIIFVAYLLVMFHFIFFYIVGLFKAKKYPKTDKKNKYGILIAARNEELVIGNLIDSIQKSNYPQDKLHIFVIAHNCTDNTAEVCKKYGATVYEYNNDNERTKGYAFKYLFECIKRDFNGVDSFDGYYIFDADNVVKEDYFDKMNDAFEYYGHKYVITSFRNSKNFGYNIISGLYGIYFALGCFNEARGRNLLGCSTRVQGCGYVFSSDVVKNGWRYVTLTEDWEFTADQILDGNKVRYCDEAIFYDEQPTTFKIMWRQRVRWSRGHLLVFYDRIKDLFTSLFKKNTVHKFSLYDIFVNCLPFCLFLTLLSLIQFILILFAPLQGLDLKEVLICYNHNESFFVNLFTSQGYLMTMLRNGIIGYIGAVITAINVFILGKDRLYHVSFIKKLVLIFFWPLFLIIQFPMDVQAVFSRNLGWKVIPHDDATTIHAINAKKKK